MKKSLVILTLLTAMAGVLSFSGAAQAYTCYHPASFHGRYDRQWDRIHQGVWSGELNRREAWDLRHDERGLHREAWYYRNVNGRGLSPAERQDLRHDLNRQSHEIYAFKHNGAERPWAQ